jgi:group I intron endonuclease
LKSSGIYVIRNLVNNKVYVGSTKNFYNRKATHFKLLKENKHWNIKLQRSFDYHGEANFRFEIIERLSYEKEVIIERENFFIQSLNAKNNGYNIADASFGDILSTHPFKEEIKAKISKSLKETFSQMSIEERKEKFGLNGERNGMFGKKHSYKSKRLMSDNQKKFKQIHGHGPTKGRKASEEHRNKISKFARTRTKEKNPFFGKQHSEETKRKISESNSGRRPTNALTLVVDEIEYETRDIAEKATGIKASTLYYRARSNNPKFNNTYFKEEQNEN